MGVRNLAEAASKLLDGKTDFGTFARATRGDYERMAAHLARRWAPPGWFSTEDLVQELLASTWLRIWSYDETRGTALARFLVYNVMSDAKRKLHKARGAKLSGTADKNPSRIEAPLSSLARRGEVGEEMTIDEAIARFASDEATAERDIIAGEEARDRMKLVMSACRTPLERRAVNAILQTGDVDAAGAILYDDVDLRIDLEVGSEQIMAEFAASLVADVVERLS